MELLDYTAPSDLEGALQALHDSPGARPLAGGHRLILDLKRRTRRIPLLVDLAKVPGLRGVSRAPGGELRIGSMTTIADLVADPAVRESHAHALLSDAAETLPDPQVRNRGTVGGSVVAGTDLAAALIALDAVAEIQGRGGRHRTLTVEHLLDPGTGPGLAADEVITSVGVPTGTSIGAYARQPVPATLSSLCGVAVSVTFRADGEAGDCRAVVCGDGLPARRVPDLERALTAPPGKATAPPLGDVFQSDQAASGEYRAHLAWVLARRALARARERAA
ncbi:FAD binding domain-containing protein [Spongiactinospora sp. TRM90649]|uniref:FAD binding domain-containing protein n=1 Tax=Spongiactinospora sp. TRM90649 TaxID=3031114 RepID=UPI0023F652A7|nr:FAD binding domain-containing protein [Spongiactinospora sp. TRM90649]MDF5752061.1 FAD binding domain-containing protein [Spongiactinospora sp. TRM90649]